MRIMASSVRRFRSRKIVGSDCCSVNRPRDSGLLHSQRQKSRTWRVILMSACVVCVLLTWLILVILILSVFSFRFSPFEWWSSRDEKIPFPTVPSKDRYQLDWKEDRIIYNSNTTPAMFHHSSLAHSRIPQILIFTHSTNLLSVDNEDATRYGPNILRNIGMYVKAWNEQSFAEISNDNNTISILRS